MTTGTARAELAIDGMTCAACASRIQNRLDGLDAVAAAQVNFATGRATITHDGSLDESLVATEIAALGYSVIAAGDSEAAEKRHQSDLLARLVIGAVLTVPSLLISMMPALQFDGREWLVAVLAAVVIVGSGWPFHRAYRFL